LQNERSDEVSGKVKGYMFIDGDERHAAHPNTWYIPTREERDAVRIGDFIQVGFEPIFGPGGGERMWILVTAINPDGTYVGELNNEPVQDFHQLDLGDVVDGIEKRHIINIIRIKHDDKDDTGADSDASAGEGDAATSVASWIKAL
jgi:hypothetical protein